MVTRVDHVREALLRLPIQFRRNGIIGTETASAVAVEGPTASFTANADGLEVDFTDTSTEGDAAITGWSWDFDGEDTSTEQNPTHTFASGGTKTVTLEVTDANGNTDSTQMEVEVEGVTVPTDGPNDVYVPETTAHFDALSIPPPTDLYVCDEASGNLASATGTDPLVASGSGHLYQQSVAGWSSPFVGLNDGGGDAWGKSVSLSAGESCIVLAYLSVAATANRNIMAAAGSGNRVLLWSSSGGVLRTEHSGAIQDGAVDHRGLSDVHAVMWIRNASDNASGTNSEIEPITGTHDESAVTGDLSLGLPGGNPPDIRCCRIFRWDGSDADALIAAGLANESLLELLNWELGAGYA